MLMRHRWRPPSAQAAAHGHATEHPGVPAYIIIGVILAIITGIEVAVTYIDPLEDVLPPILIALAVVKFVGVAGWYMHLRFDSPVFTALFAGGIALAFTVFLVVLAVFRVLFV